MIHIEYEIIYQLLGVIGLSYQRSQRDVLVMRRFYNKQKMGTISWVLSSAQNKFYVNYKFITKKYDFKLYLYL